MTLTDSQLSGLIGSLSRVPETASIGLSLREERYLAALVELQAYRNGLMPHKAGEAPITITGKLAWLANNYAGMELRTSPRKLGVTLELYSPEGLRVVWASEPTLHEVIGCVFEQIRPVNFEPVEVPK